MINEILSDMNNRYHFNSGGCCYVAYLIAKELERLNEPFKLVIQSSSQKGNHYCIACNRFGTINPLMEYVSQVKFRASSETIKKIYADNEWSLKYDTCNNKLLKDEINRLFSIYK